MKLFLHACCADCLLKILASLEDEKTEVTAYFYNPNIHPRAEYQSRLAAIKKVAEEKGVRLVVPDWQPKDYFGVIGSGGKRCEGCWKLRLEKAAVYAKERGFEYFSTTLLSSQYQNRKIIEKIGAEAAKRCGLIFFVPKKIITELKTKGFYKQFFCGCVYSLKERFEEKYVDKEKIKKDK
jgi:predicted adenine nucleotide alpha hydrolase (AANH) superfamily ATPase